MSRFNEFRACMLSLDVKWEAVAEVLSLTPNYARTVLKGQFIKEEYHTKLVEVGFPEEVLPPIRKPTILLPKSA